MILQRCLAGYRPWGHKESDMPEWLSAHTHPSYCFLVASPLSLDVGYLFYLFIFFLMFSNILLSMFVQQLNAILVF